METAFYRCTVTGLACFIFACSSPAEPAPSGPATAGSGGSTAGSTGQSGGGGSGGVTSPSGGSGGNSAVAGTGGGGTGGSGGSVSQAGSGGQGGSTSQVPEGVPPNYTLQLDQPFATEAALTSLLQGNPGGWTFDAADGGALVFNGTGYTAPSAVMESLSSFAIISTTKFSSFVLDVELMQTNPDTAQPHRDICIVFNAISESQFLYAHIAQTHDDRSHNIHLIDNAPRVPLTETDNGGIQWGTNEWHKVRLVRDAVGGNIAVYWDAVAEPIITATSTAFTEGYIGFGTFQDSGKIRNLKIWAESSVAMPAGNFFGG